MSANAITARKSGALAALDQHFDDAIPRLQELHAELFRHVVYSPNRVRPLSIVIAEAEAIIASGQLGQIEAAVTAASVPASVGEIGACLAKLIASFPNASRTPLQAYGEALAEDVGDERPSHFALASACRRLRRTCKFLPTIAEMIEVMQEEESRLRCARLAIEKLPGNLERARAVMVRDDQKLIAVEEREDEQDDDESDDNGGDEDDRESA